MPTAAPCNSWSELSGDATPSFFRMCRTSPVDRQVPTIEQCRLVLKSQILVRRAGPAAGAGVSSRRTRIGGASTKISGLGGRTGYVLVLMPVFQPAAVGGL